MLTMVGPRFHFPIWAKVAIASICALGLLAGPKRGRAGNPTEEKKVSLTFRVVDGKTGEPIADAKVRITSMKPDAKEDTPESHGKTKEDGTVVLKPILPVEKDRELAPWSWEVLYKHYWVKATVEGYQPFIGPLDKVTSVAQGSFLRGAKHMIKLKRGQEVDLGLDDFAGEYEAEGAKLWIEADGAFLLSAVASKSKSSAMRDYYGLAMLEAGVLELTPSRSDWKEVFKKSFGKYYAISWGDRRYLVEEEKLGAFCDSVNMGFEPRTKASGSFLSRGTDKGVRGVPEMPSEWQTKILEHPIEGKIIEVLPDGKAKVNLGWRSGVWNGMGLLVIEPGGSRFRPANVLSVGRDECVLDHDASAKPFALNKKVSSRAPASAIEKIGLNAK